MASPSTSRGGSALRVPSNPANKRGECTVQPVSAELDLPPLPEVLSRRSNPYLSRCPGSSSKKLESDTEDKRKHDLSRAKIEKLVARLAHPNRNAALETYETHVAEVLQMAGLPVGAPRPSSPPRSPTKTLSQPEQRCVERLYTQALDARSQTQSLLKRKYLGPLLHTPVSITNEQLTDFIQRNYVRASRPSSQSNGRRSPEQDDGTRPPSRARKDHVEHFYVADVESGKRSRQQLMEKYMKPLSDSRPLTPAQVKATSDRLSPPPSSRR